MVLDDDVPELDAPELEVPDAIVVVVVDAPVEEVVPAVCVPLLADDWADVMAG